MKNTKPSLTLAITGLITSLFFSNLSFAENAKPNNTYQEMEFIQTFKGKNKAFVLQTLGQPTKKSKPVKPSNADSIVGQANGPANLKKDEIEMWYYFNLVKYNSKNTYKQAEITFINDAATNMMFLN
ncbi:hypothetical protein [Methylotenera sp. L2L1]|uniref:hypothetical protein n=1 Tax=Methylotenera sp. L2L1 TaxID=1502770 RepID=UPI00068F68A3|nr:hypothetical protein [Methylotenera sp. L2L1]